MIGLGLVCLLVSLSLFVRGRRVLKFNTVRLMVQGPNPRPAILIPARDESKVIEGLLDSIEKQSVTMHPDDVYVIVEDALDPTVEICRKRGVSVIVREKLNGRRRKGFALDDAVKEILKHKHYDVYFIFDADNRLAKNYLEKMLMTYARGYQMATGYRHSKNANTNVIAAVSSLTFSMINVLGNTGRLKHGANMIFSGTGCYVDGKLVEKWKGWPFRSLTEDYEMSLYATLHGISTFYNDQAVFYDEQPVRFGQTVDQRVRWIKGYFGARKKYVPLIKRRIASMKKSGTEGCGNYGSLVREVLGVKAVIWLIVGLILLTLGGVFWAIWLSQALVAVGMIVGVVAVVYLVLVVVTILMVKREKMRLRSGVKWRAVLFNPIYLVTYIWCALKALLSKDVAWKKIEHGAKIR